MSEFWTIYKCTNTMTKWYSANNAAFTFGEKVTMQKIGVPLKNWITAGLYDNQKSNTMIISYEWYSQFWIILLTKKKCKRL